MMELKKLRYFVAVASLKNFTAAAKELNTVQPAISRQIADLEATLGATLLIRNTREVKLTEAGEYLLNNAYRMFELEQEITSRVKEIDKGEVGKIRIGYLASASFIFIGELVKMYSKKFPNVQVKLVELTSQEQINAFDKNEIDIGFSRPIPKNMNNGIGYSNIYNDKLMVVLPDGHRLAKQRHIAISSLENENIILLNRLKASGLFNKIIDLFSSVKIMPNIDSQPKNMQTLLTEVSANMGVGIAPACIKRLYAQGCIFVPFEGVDVSIPLEIQYPLKNISTSAKGFVDFTIEKQDRIEQLIKQNHI